MITTPTPSSSIRPCVYIERLPDTVQKDHIDWGFRLAPIYGENYRYTTAFGLWSYQLLNQNKNYGYDLPMAYGEVFIPQIAEGLLIRFGRFISVPDIEAQLAPNNYMYTHSMTYTFDNYTNTGIQTTLGGDQELDVAARPLGRQRHHALACRRDDSESVPEPALSGSHHAEGSGRGAQRYRRRALDQRQRQRQRLRGGRRPQRRPVGLQQPAMARNNLLSQVQRSVAHLVRDLQFAREQCAQCAQSCWS